MQPPQETQDAVRPKSGPGTKPLSIVSLVGCIATITILFVQPTAVLADECNRVAALDSYEVTGITPDGSICVTFDGLNNSRGVSCHWEFPFRSDEATRAFDETWSQVTRCRDGVHGSGNSPVNHPDSYELREMITKNRIYRVAKKDKSLRNRTLIFLSTEYRD